MQSTKLVIDKKIYVKKLIKIKQKLLFISWHWQCRGSYIAWIEDLGKFGQCMGRQAGRSSW